MKRINFIENEAFSKKINIELFNEIVNFILSTTKIDKQNIVEQLRKNTIWFNRKIKDDIQNKYGIKYFGELLERYEQKISNDIENTRAIAIAVGYMKNLITEDMIIGTQLVDFINKIKDLSENDIYLKGALILYDKEMFESYIEELLKIKHTNSENILFVFSLFEDKESIFEELKEELIRLLGKDKTISPINNIKTYAWLIENVYKLIAKKRKKGIELLKALCIIPTKLLKEDSDEYRILMENGYTEEEIAFLNYAVLHYSHIPKTVRLGNSIVEEKILIRFCKTVINGDKEQEQYIYDLIKELIKQYWNFDIKYAGSDNLKKTLLEYENINIINPITFLNLYETFNNKIFAFDILDKKWDILAEKMEKECYRELFDDYLQNKDLQTETIRESIKRYDELTQTSYIESFLKYIPKREYLFTKLVDKNIILLIDFYENSKDTKENTYLELKHLKNYINGIPTKQAFLFLQYILENKKYDIDKIEKFTFNLKNLYGNRRYFGCYGADLMVDKEFLNLDEKKKLFFWLDNYMFKNYPREYLTFVSKILEADIMLKLFSKKQLREIYFMLIENDESLAKNETLREKYLTKEELEKIENKEKEIREEQKRQELIKIQERIQRKFNELPKNDFKQIYDFCRKYRWDKEEWDISFKIVKEYINGNIKNFPVDEKQLLKFFELLELFIEQQSISIEEIKNYIEKYLKMEEIYNGKYRKTYKNCNNDE